jgi:hypothetical protein
VAEVHEPPDFALLVLVATGGCAGGCRVSVRRGAGAAGCVVLGEGAAVESCVDSGAAVVGDPLVAGCGDVPGPGWIGAVVAAACCASVNPKMTVKALPAATVQRWVRAARRRA